MIVVTVFKYWYKYGCSRHGGLAIIAHKNIWKFFDTDLTLKNPFHEMRPHFLSFTAHIKCVWFCTNVFHLL